MRSFRTAAGVFVALTLVLLANHPAAAAETIRIGYLGPLTGVLAQAGKDMLMGEDPLHDDRVLNRGDELHPPGTAKRSASRTGQQVFRNQLFLFVSLALMKEPLEPILL